VPVRCGVCRLALSKNDAACPDCTQQKPDFDRVVAAFDYQAPGDLLIQQFKAGRRFGMARMLAEILAQRVNSATPALPRNTILVPVPASRAAILERGFNPSAEIARYLAYQLNLPCRPDLLVRHQEGSRQKYLTRAQRVQSALELYSCPARLDQAHIAVVDDVLTTGSTLHAIARQFKRAGAASVYGLVLARTPYR
jgi:ComF family protein